jgi:hypothetical protein
MYTFSGSSRTPVGATTGYLTDNPITGSIAVNPNRDTLVVLMLINAGGAARSGGAPTFGANTMLQVDTSRRGGTSPEISAEMWYITASGIGQATITDTDISVPNGGADRIAFDLVSAYAGPGKTSVLQVATGSAVASTSTNPYCTITTTAGSTMIFEVVANGANTWAPTARTGNFTNINDNDIGNYGGGMMYAITNIVGPITGSWTFATAEDWGVVMGAFGERGALAYPNTSTHLTTSTGDINLTQHELYTLSPDNSSHLQASGNVELTYNPPPQQFTLVLDSSAHAQAAGNVDLTAYVPNYTLSVNSTGQIQVSGNVTLTAYSPAGNAVPDSTQHLQSSGSIILTQHYGALTLDSSAHAQATSSVTLTAYVPNFTLTVNGAVNTQASSSVTLTQHQILAVNGAQHAQASGNVVLTAYIPNFTLTVNSSAHAQASGNVVLTQHQVLVVDSAQHTQVSTTVTLVQGGAIGVQPSVHAVSSGALALTQHQILATNGASHLQTSGIITLSQGTALALVNNAVQAQSSGNVALTQHYILVVLIATQLLSSSNVSLGGGGVIPIKMMHYIRLRSK